MVQKIMTLESTVESLHAELVELGSSDTLTRAKQQHESVVTSMRQKFDTDVLAAKEKIDSLTKKLTEKVTNISDTFCYSVIGCLPGLVLIDYPRESEGLWNHRRWFVCLFVCLFVCYHDN